MAVKPEVNPLQLIGGRKFVAFMTTAWFFHTGQVTEETYSRCRWCSRSADIQHPRAERLRRKHCQPAGVGD